MHAVDERVVRLHGKRQHQAFPKPKPAPPRDSGDRVVPVQVFGVRQPGKAEPWDRRKIQAVVARLLVREEKPLPLPRNRLAGTLQKHIEHAAQRHPDIFMQRAAGARFGKRGMQLIIQHNLAALYTHTQLRNLVGRVRHKKAKRMTE